MNYACKNQCSFSFACEFEDDYGGGGDIQGQVVQDVISWTGSPAWNVSDVDFGQITSASGSFVVNPEDGIMGFAYQGLSSWQTSCVFSQMSNVYQSLSMCLTPLNPVVEFGTNYRASQKSSFNWTTIYDSPGWFIVYLTDAGMAGKSLGISESKLNSGYGWILDSGTTFIIVDTEVMKIYTQRLMAMCQQGIHLVGLCDVTNSSQTILDGYCFNMTAQQVAMYPSLYFTFWNNDDHSKPFTVTIPPQLLLVQACGGSAYALGVQAMPGLGVMILGDIFLQSSHVVFDKADGVIGIRPLSGCPK